ncbi:hypothetical protein QTP86_011202 [Hemibagrus guttatus]|nr:hypothetical protein QTP86_011202 [Hemibagrus guttatus]
MAMQSLSEAGERDSIACPRAQGLSRRAHAFSVEALVGNSCKRMKVEKAKDEKIEASDCDLDTSTGTVVDEGEDSEYQIKETIQSASKPAEDKTDPDTQIQVELQGSDLWSRFHEIGTEMIITKAGRRMFPSIRVKVRNLDPFKQYYIAMDIKLVDSKRYRYVYHSSQWMVAGNTDHSCITPRLYIHPDSPCSGETWMRQVISFDRVKLTNNEMDDKGHIILQSMHKYKPRVHVVVYEPSLDVSQISALPTEGVCTFSFPETQFTTVTAYQNQQITKLKIDRNPFAKGFRDPGRNRGVLDGVLDSYPWRNPFGLNLKPFTLEMQELGQKGSRDSQPKAAMKANHLSHKLPVSVLLLVDEMICAVKGAITNDSAEKEKRQVPRQRNPTRYWITTIQGKPLGKGLVQWKTPELTLRIGCLHKEMLSLLVLEESAVDAVLGCPGWLNTNRTSVPAALEKLRGAHIFSKLDLRSAYNLIRIRRGDEWKTAFITPTGHCEYLVMPYGLSNTPSVFQSFMNEIFRDMLHRFVVVYIDDILIYSPNLSDHVDHVKQVLHRLRHYHLYLKLERCEFHQSTTQFLGYVISPEGIQMDCAKVEAIKSWPQPDNVKDLQRFLGFANFYCCFISGYSDLTAPLTSPLRKKPKNLSWTSGTIKAFWKLKATFCMAPTLVHADPTRPFIVEMDASALGVGAVLSQRRGATPVLHPCAYFSKKLSPVEQNYDIRNRELLAIKLALEEWRHWLEGANHPFEVITDHKNLQHLREAKCLNPRQAQWALFFTQFNFCVTYRPGNKNTKADTLSRIHSPDAMPEEPEPILPPDLCPITWLKVDNIRAATEEEPALPGGPDGKAYVPTSLRLSLLDSVHVSPGSGHPGRQ